MCWYAADPRARDGVTPLAYSRERELLGSGAPLRAQCAHESRGNRIRRTPLVARRLFFAPMGVVVKGLIFALLYRNLMATCQIWCERSALHRTRSSKEYLPHGRLGARG